MGDNTTAPAPRIGRPPLGPFPADGVEPAPLDLDTLHQLTSILAVVGDADAVGGLLRPFNGRARAALVAALQGRPDGLCAAAAGIALSTLKLWRSQHEAFRLAYQTASEWGFSGALEGELYRRALAGADDRGSARLLEVALKARSPSYRDKQQTQLTVIHEAREHRRQLVAGWDVDGEAREVRDDDE